MVNEELKHINGDYYEWLVDIVDSDHKYLDLLSYLFDQDFDKEVARLVVHDGNRIADAFDLREQFISEQLARDPHYLIETFRNQTCSVLEVFIALAQRMEDIMNLNRFPDWFWEMMDNIGLAYFDDEHWDDEALFEADRIIGMWLNREYGKDGKGGLFPLKDPQKNQQNVEIWYQMNAYLIENYA